MIILGIDPGSVRIGYGAIRQEKNQLFYLKSGLLNFPSHPAEQRLLAVQKSFKKLLREIRPDLIGLEKIYFVKNQKTGLEVAQSRGIIIAAILEQKIPFIEMTPPEIKKALTGDGRADKKGVAKMVSFFLHLNKNQIPKIDDITDALAIAISSSYKNIKLT
ncbi:crossover junction endodeoxyribonuclease RuvC [Candidatus Jorgensenbacteria bacterium CG03_land_8_20_14_0_80_38_39]|uniref:Crossover junction endodeoxyribonuclease RuvC n=1 Tax=Candidatus Jorgensenbacteria bacterium CG11_big_fil_rev_8_21_14_0_20_38_23 TaxID=1974594 RepID=A0A2H0NBE6_9BACT|nr:MAG: crossover junction endodeoxyribonuclease RuvC [Candidatus Jorgensenbacteria bacterium CG11_big_fil_rev_8_21_14_0_20_38_23]PIV13034.1 MAG: crossover junction endodeoxyribonuclease RuvC [Candidatus Jorgensenbacteria bacterium CG03_land_8_20_14_0_80_38_39]